MPKTAQYHACVIGVGSMGLGMAQSCVAAGLPTCGIDPIGSKRELFAASGVQAVAATAAELDGAFDAVVLAVANADQCRTALFGDSGTSGHLAAATPVMICSTVATADAIAINAALERRGLLMLDAPMSGGPLKASQGALTIMAAGPNEAFAKLKPVLDAVAERVYTVGPDIGKGSTVKIIHQLLAVVHIAAAAEAIALAARAGIPLDLMCDVVVHAAGNFWMFENRMNHVVNGDYTPRSAVDIFVKDLGLVTEIGRVHRFPLPLASTAQNMFVHASASGFGNEDDSAVIKIFPGITLPEMRPEQE